MTKHRVLIPVDGSEFSRQILGEVPKFLDARDNELALLRVAQPPAGLTGKPMRPASAEVPVPMYESVRDVEYTYHPVYASQEWESLMARLKDELDADKVYLQNAGYSVQVVVRFGDPAQAIVQYVADENVDLVAMTTHGRSGLSRLVMGSVAEHVVRNVSVPVLLLRAVEGPPPTLNES